MVIVAIEVIGDDALPDMIDADPVNRQLPSFPQSLISVMLGGNRLDGLLFGMVDGGHAQLNNVTRLVAYIHRCVRNDRQHTAV